MTELRAALDAERDSLEEELASHGRSIPEGKSAKDWQGSTGDLTGEESDPNDTADKIEELITNVPLVEELERRYKDVSEALGRMDRGAYGVCEVCRKEIDGDRLEVNPAARTCVEHSAA